jgi:hypothetical protein
VGGRAGGRAGGSAVARAKTGTSDWLSRRVELGSRNCFFLENKQERQNPFCFRAVVCFLVSAWPTDPACGRRENAAAESKQISGLTTPRVSAGSWQLRMHAPQSRC